jgi:hypothetical protein
MKRILFIVFIVLFFIAIASWLFVHFYNVSSDKAQAASDYHLTKEEISLIHDGDLILRHGYGFVSDIIVQTLGEVYDISHVSVVSKDSSGKIIVIHSVSKSLAPWDGVQSQDLASFIHDSKENSVIIVRYKPKIPGKDNSGISRRALEYLKKRVPFDNSFDIKDSSEIYCQELPWLCIKDEFGDDVFTDHYNKRKDHMRFDNFLDTSRFEIILNHHLRKKIDHKFHNIGAHHLGNTRVSVLPY